EAGPESAAGGPRSLSRPGWRRFPVQRGWRAGGRPGTAAAAVRPPTDNESGGALLSGGSESDAGPGAGRAPVMDNQCTVQVKLELGHRAQLRKKPTTEGFTHDWMVFVRGPEQCDIQHFVEKVIFRLHDSFPKPKRVCKEPPYKVEESGYAGFIMLIEVYFKNKEEPRKVCFTYDLFLNLEGNPPVNHLRCEKLTFNNPTTEFRCKLLMAGGDANKESGKASKPHKVAREHRER
ncbi:myeloid/lymphoid or mixed lineage-leukemia translocation to 1 homolog (Drosophila), isoform CRA_b, partial [Mus musculus]